MSFRQKILFAQVALLIAFIAIAYPLVEKGIRKSAFENLKTSSYVLTSQLEKAQDGKQLIVLVEEMQKDLLSNYAHQFKPFFYSLCFLALLFFGGSLWLIFHRINYPLKQIIRAIKPYQLGQAETIAPIQLSPSIDMRDHFYHLAQTLNSLSERLKTHIQNLADERSERETLLESLGEGVIDVDSDLNVRYVNYVGSRMLGIPRRLLLGKPLPQAGEKHTAPLLEKCHDLLRLSQQKLTLLTDSIALGEDSKTYLDLIAAPKSQHVGAILVIQDKSSQHKVLEMGKDFVANASHELRTPITIIKGFAETLHDLPELPKEMVGDITEKIVRNCQRMDNLIKNLLMLADIENIPESRFQACDLVALLESCRHVVLTVYEDAEITIENSEETVIGDADPDVLELAIINLLDNAAKYSTAPARINVKVSRLGEEGVITISDQGIGIPAKDVEHIFERFYTVDKARSRRHGGAGLGLSLVKTIIDKHQGSISVISTLGEGTIFTITLPLHRSLS